MKSKIRLAYIVVFLIISAISLACSITHSKSLLMFTILSNIFCWLLMLVELKNALQRRPASPALVRTEFIATLMILITGIVYNTLLGDIFSEQYWQYTNVVNHLAVPLMFTFYFFYFQKVEYIRRREVFMCLVPPYAYIAMIMIRHAVVGDTWFPYFFFDINKIGIANVVLYIVILTVIFELLGFALLYFCRKIAKHKKQNIEKT